MSLYNALFGTNPASDFFLGLLNLTREDVGRFRDVYLDGDEIAVYTRNGSGNRECSCAISPKYAPKACGGPSYEEEVDETVTITAAEAAEKGYKLLSIYMGDNKQMALTGRRVMETRWRCKEPSSESCACTGCIITYRLPEHPLYLRDEDDDFDATYATIYFRAPAGTTELLKAMSTPPQDTPRAMWDKLFASMEQGKKPEVLTALGPFVKGLKDIIEGSKSNDA